jgi:YVTN family beta-propeller protein
LVEFRILGPLEIVEHGRRVAVGAPKVRALLAVLLLHRGEVVSSDRLIDALWGERAPATAAKTVQVYVSNLRKALGIGLVVTGGRGYVLETGADQVDADRFKALSAEGRSALEAGDPRAAAKRLREALALWRGPALADFAYEQFAQTAIAKLEEARLEALEDRIDADLAVGAQAGLVGELEALVAEHPLRERLQGQLMLALYRSGRQADALEHYRKTRQSMVEQLGLEPGPRLQELERAILAQDPALDPPTRESRPGPAAVARRRHGGWLIAAAGAILLAALVGAAIKLSGSGSVRVRIPPNSVAVIDPQTNTLVASGPAGTRPGPVVFDAGSLWVANLDDQTVSRIDPGSLRTLHTFPLPDPPTGLAAGGDSIWVVESNAQAPTVSVNAIDPQFNLLGATKRLTNLWAGGPGAVAARGNAVWVAPSSGLLTRLDPATSQTVRQLDPNSGPAAIALGSDGAVWLTDSEADNVTRVDPTGALTPVPVGNGPDGIAVGDGAVWVADSQDDTIVRIDPVTVSVSTTIEVGRSPAGIAVGAGSVWVANTGDGTVTRIDPRTNRIQAVISVGGSPQAITIADGRAWVTVDQETIKPTDLASDGGTLRMESELNVNSTDPPLEAFPPTPQILYATCAKLLNFPDEPGPEGSRLVPEVAEALPARSADGKTYTLTIRPGFRFSPPSDQPVTAQTFKDTIERAMDPRMKSGFGPEFSDIVGAAAFVAGKAPHISGIVVRGNQLAIHLLAPAADLPARLTEPGLCAVPSGTPIDPNGVRGTASAGPYYVASYDPNQGVVLVRNPNYRGSRPHGFARIEIATGISYQRGIADVKAGTADYMTLAGPGAAGVQALASQLDARYGPGSQAASSGAQQYFVSPQLEVDYFVLNTHRRLFQDARLRQAVSYAIDRAALAREGDPYDSLPDRPTDHYLPPGIPGYSDARVYPLTPDLARARALAQGRGRTAVLYTCEQSPCPQQAQILKTDLAAIGLQLKIKAFPVLKMWPRTATPGEPFDITTFGWVANFPDPAGVLPFILDASPYPAFDDPTYQRRLAEDKGLAGPERYLAYGKLDIDLARNAAPLLAYGNASVSDFLSARIGCETYGISGLDLAALCVKHPSR